MYSKIEVPILAKNKKNRKIKKINIFGENQLKKYSKIGVLMFQKYSKIELIYEVKFLVRSKSIPKSRIIPKSGFYCICKKITVLHFLELYLEPERYETFCCISCKSFFGKYKICKKVKFVKSPNFIFSDKTFCNKI